MHYQNILIGLYRPFVEESSGHDPSILGIVEDTSKHLQTLIRLYYLRHSFDSTNSFLTQPLALIAFLCIGIINEKMGTSEFDPARSTLFLALKGLDDQGRNFYGAQSLFEVVKSKIRPEEAALLRDLAGIKSLEGNGEKSLKREMQGQFPLSVSKEPAGPSNVETQRWRKLAEEYLNVGESGCKSDGFDL